MYSQTHYICLSRQWCGGGVPGKGVTVQYSKSCLLLRIPFTICAHVSGGDVNTCTSPTSGGAVKALCLDMLPVCHLCLWGVGNESLSTTYQIHPCWLIKQQWWMLKLIHLHHRMGKQHDMPGNHKSYKTTCQTSRDSHFKWSTALPFNRVHLEANN